MLLPYISINMTVLAPMKQQDREPVKKFAWRCQLAVATKLGVGATRTFTWKDKSRMLEMTGLDVVHDRTWGDLSSAEYVFCKLIRL